MHGGRRLLRFGADKRLVAAANMVGEIRLGAQSPASILVPVLDRAANPDYTPVKEKHYVDSSYRASYPTGCARVLR